MKYFVLVFSFLLILLFCVPPIFAEDKFTQKDRELLIELKVKITEIDKRFEQIDKRFEQAGKQIDQLIHFLYILAGIFTSLVVAVIGFGYWDRKTIIKEARREAIEFMENQGLLRKVLDALKDLAREDTKLANALKRFNLL